MGRCFTDDASVLGFLRLTSLSLVSAGLLTLTCGLLFPLPLACGFLSPLAGVLVLPFACGLLFLLTGGLLLPSLVGFFYPCWRGFSSPSPSLVDFSPSLSLVGYSYPWKFSSN